MIKIVPFESGHSLVFKKLNTEWITDVFGQVTEADQQVLDSPEELIINAGGAIMIALHRDIVVGTCALINKGSQIFELAKMAVAPEARGKKVGLTLGEAIIAEARQISAEKLILETHSVLVPAIHLYKKLGFVETCGGNTNTLCNLQMELELQK